MKIGFIVNHDSPVEVHAAGLFALRYFPMILWRRENIGDVKWESILRCPFPGCAY